MNPKTSAATPPGWTQQRERSTLWVLRLMSWIARTVGRRATRLLLHPIALYFLVTGGAARRESRRYLGRALRRPANWRDLYRHVHCFACTVLDRVYLLQGQHADFAVRLVTSPTVDAAFARGHGALLLGAHMGSFEVLRAMGGQQGLRVTMLMFEENARLIGATLAAIAPQADLHTIALGRAHSMLELRRWLDDGGVAGLLADRTLAAPAHAQSTHGAQGAAGATGTPGTSGSAGSHRSRTLRLPFLGHDARFSDGPFRLAALLRRPVVFMTGLYFGGNRYEVRLIELDDFSQPAAPGVSPEQRLTQALQTYVATLEALCLEAPYNWFNFFDFWADDHADHAAA